MEIKVFFLRRYVNVDREGDFELGTKIGLLFLDTVQFVGLWKTWLISLNAVSFIPIIKEMHHAPLEL